MWPLTRITSAGNEIVFAKTFSTFDDSDSEIEFQFGTPPYAIVLRFATDPTTKEQLTDITPQENNRLLITFRNFDTPLGIANVDPIRIGTFDARPTYLRYTVHTIGETRSRLVTLTIFVGAA